MKNSVVVALFCAVLGAFSSVAFSHADGVYGGKLPTRWDKNISATYPLPDYPRPQMTREAWQSLNGTWDHALTGIDEAAPPTGYSGKILVPYPYKSALSGVGKASPTTQRVWYRRSFVVPAAWAGERVLLHFGAVNWASAVFVNGRSIGRHFGGYDSFDDDITDALKPGTDEMAVSAYNPLRSDTADAQVLGKQRLHPGGIFYTGSTGIWQTVWLEPVPAAHIDDIKLTPDIDHKALHIVVDAAQGQHSLVRLAAMEGALIVSQVSGVAGDELTLPI